MIKKEQIGDRISHKGSKVKSFSRNPSKEDDSATTISDVQKKDHYDPNAEYIWKFKNSSSEEQGKLTKEKFEKIHNNFFSANKSQKIIDSFKIKNVGEESKKSYYVPNKVHSITFNHRVETSAQPQKEFIIYRKLSEKEFEDIKKNKDYSLVIPSNEKEHFKDVYYFYVPTDLVGINTNKNKYDKEYKYFTYLKLEDFKSLDSELKKEFKASLVPIEDIANKRIGVRYTPLDNIKRIFDEVKRISKKSTNKLDTKSVTTAKADDKQNIEKARELIFGDNSIYKVYQALKQTYSISKNDRYNASQRKEATKRFKNNLNNFVEILKSKTEDKKDVEQLITYVIRRNIEKTEDDELYNLIFDAVNKEFSFAPGVKKIIRKNLVPLNKSNEKGDEKKDVDLSDKEKDEKDDLEKASKIVENDAFFDTLYDLMDSYDTYKDDTSNTKFKDHFYEKITDFYFYVRKVCKRDTGVILAVLFLVKKELKNEGLFNYILEYFRSKIGQVSENMKKKRVKEMSTTGGGAAPGTGAHAVTGDGEGMATKYAFGGAGADPKKKRKKIKTMKEDTFSFLEYINSLKKR